MSAALDKARALLLKHEGKRRFPYKDTFGNITIGIGHNLAAKGASDAAVKLMFEEDLADAVEDATLVFGAQTFNALSPNRQAVLIDMAFNLGRDGLSKFIGTITAVRAGQYAVAATHMKASKWATQVPARAQELADLMQSG